MLSKANLPAMVPLIRTSPSFKVEWGCAKMYSSNPNSSSKCAVLGCSTRYSKREAELVLEETLIDMAAGVKFLRDRGYKHILSIGSSGGAEIIDFSKEKEGVYERLQEMTAAGRFDTIPSEVWERVRAAMRERSMNRHRLQLAVGTQSRGDLNDEICPSRSRLARMAEVFDDPQLKTIADSDVFWDTITSVESVGLQAVYDATVLETHNFVANGINLHNSIEQDADVVILLHREDAYERESPRAGEADLIVAKHRNGPTATVTVAFQGHYSRFVDMAPG